MLHPLVISQHLLLTRGPDQHVVACHLKAVQENVFQNHLDQHVPTNAGFAQLLLSLRRPELSIHRPHSELQFGVVGEQIFEKPLML